MRAYSLALRAKGIAALEAQEEPQRELAARFLVSLSVVERLWPRWQPPGRDAAKPRAGGAPRQLRAHTAAGRQAGAARPAATLEELRDHLGPGTGRHVSPATLGREVPRRKLPRKKGPPCRGTRPPPRPTPPSRLAGAG
jgi:transposase